MMFESLSGTANAVDNGESFLIIHLAPEVFVVKEDNDIPTTLLTSKLHPFTAILTRINLVVMFLVEDETEGDVIPVHVKNSVIVLISISSISLRVVIGVSSIICI
jgi:hypothetical protein